MKNAKKITRLHLDSSSSEEFIVIGLVSSEPDYKLSLAINRKFGISLKNTTALKSPEGSDEYSRFATVNSSGISYSLVANKSEKNLLFKKLKNIDFLFIVHDPDNMTRREEIVSSVRQTDFINGVFYIDQSLMKENKFQLLIH
ncbi:MAG TPA: IPExxxVDY family protein [Bacteroidales bacterium]|nr:IPExxxVDY family protein [Bacteroidales bacterium]